METRLALIAAALSTAGFLAWLLVTMPARSGSPPPPIVGEAPRTPAIAADASGPECELPLAWRLGEVDEAFGLDEDDATGAVADAAAMWEEALRRPAFVHDPAGGFPIRFVYDERQARTDERRRLEMELQDARRELEEATRRLAERREAHVGARRRHGDRVASHRERSVAHNDSVRAHNETGQVPGAVAARLRLAGEELEREGHRLRREARGLEETDRLLRDEAERLAGERRALDARALDLQRRFPPRGVEAGRYREANLRDGDRVVGSRREIRIFRFTDLEELRIVVAHELGHALGLEHDTVAGSIMNERYGLGDSAGRRPAAPAGSLERIRHLCPGPGEPPAAR